MQIQGNAIMGSTGAGIGVGRLKRFGAGGQGTLKP